MKPFSIFSILLLFMFSCENDDQVVLPPFNQNRVLLLTVDYTTNTFEGGTELSFGENTETFTLDVLYNPPGDFGDIEIIYHELEETLFKGTIIWMGSGERIFPENLAPASSFQTVLSTDWVTPGGGVENIFNEDGMEYNFEPVWAAVQNKVIVRAYLAANTSQTVYYFLYTPSVGVGNPEEWKWVLFFKS